jgi:glutamate racemase
MLKELLKPMLEAGIDYLVLGCSHYPYLIPTLKKLLPEHVSIIDSGMAVAKQTKVVLQSLDLLANEQQSPPQFFTNGNPQVLSNLVSTPEVSHEVSRLDF